MYYVQTFRRLGAPMEDPVPPVTSPAAAEARPRSLVRVVVPAMFVLGVLLLAVSAIVFYSGNLAMTNPTQDQINNNLNLQNVYSPVLRNLGMFFVVAAIFGAAALFDRIDPVARILLLIVALIALLLILTSGSTLFG